MKAVTYDRYGPPEVFRLKEIDKPLPGEGEVLIRVKAAEVTKADCELRSFRFPVKWFWLPLRLAFGVFKPRRQVLGGYLAGEIAALGAGVDNFSVGDKVFGSAGLKMGAYAEFVSLPADYTLVPKPDSMSFAEAAAVPLGGLNALHFMNLANIQPGHKILINGAGGSIGLFALQIAKDCGAEVTVVDKTIKKEMLLQHGADKFIDYTQEDFGECPPDYDVVFDMVAQSSYSKCLKVLKPGGHYLIGNPRFSNMLRAVWTSRMSDKTVSFAFARETKEELLTLKALLEEGKIKPPIDTIYRMEQAAEAHYRVEAEERIGMVVLSMDSRSNEGQ